MSGKTWHLTVAVIFSEIGAVTSIEAPFLVICFTGTRRLLSAFPLAPPVQTIWLQASDVFGTVVAVMVIWLVLLAS